MSEKEKGAILNQVHNLPPLQKARALGFMQGLAAANADGDRSVSSPQEESDTKMAQADQEERKW